MVKIKICGLTNQDDYDFTVRCGADYTGFIFYEKSPRYISPKSVSHIISKGHHGDHLKVGVFVNEKAEKIREIVHHTGIDIVQLHGDETPEFCSNIGLPHWKAIRVKDINSINDLSLYSCDKFLLDTFSKHLYGGTGKIFNKDIARDAIRTRKNILLAGGISADNIHQFTVLSPYGVDISSGIENIPGKKDHHKMTQLFEKLKNPIT